MKSPATLALCVFFICWASVVGCNRSSTNEVTTASADADAPRAEAEAAKTGLAQPRAELIEPATTEQQVDPDLARRTAEWVLQMGGGLEVALLEGGYQFPVKSSDELPEKPFRLHLIAFVDYPKPIDEELGRLQGVSLTALWLANSQATDAGLTHVKGIKNLENLNLGGSKVTDAGLAVLAGLPNLRSLSLGRGFTDAALVHVANLKQLEELYINDSDVTDTGLAHLKGLNDLQGLEAHYTRIGDTGLKVLNDSLPGLRSLGAAGANITDAGLAHLKLTALESLDANENPGITDAGLIHFKDLPNLKRLNLGETAITDVGLDTLAMLKLTEVWLGNTKVTDAGVSKLENAVQGLRVNR
jgi:hypothetical protein